MECLHTLLLGPYKYLFAELMDQMSPVQKNETSARVEVFDFSSFKSRLKSSICRYHKSFNGKTSNCWLRWLRSLFGTTSVVHKRECGWHCLRYEASTKCEHLNSLFPPGSLLNKLYMTLQYRFLRWPTAMIFTLTT